LEISIIKFNCIVKKKTKKWLDKIFFKLLLYIGIDVK